MRIDLQVVQALLPFDAASEPGQARPSPIGVASQRDSLTRAIFLKKVTSNATVRESDSGSAGVTVIVPAYNEAASLPALMPSLIAFVQARGWQLIVVDDGSVDDTPTALEPYSAAPGVTLLRHKVNRGYGGALKTGISAATTDLVATIDADGQHHLEDLDALHMELQRTDADMVVGDRGRHRSSLFREIGKGLIRLITKTLMTLPIRDLNSGLKLYRTDLAQRYVHIYPDSMAFSDVITIVFLHRRHLVREHPITVKPRQDGNSTISTLTAFETVMAILNIITLFNPMRIFLPLSLASLIAGVVWGTPIVLRGDGVSVGAMLAIATGVLSFALGLIAEQLSAIRKSHREE